ncbi:MAG: antA/AntB antirepressor family protein [Candidatus Thiodiazotropha sp. (ex Epidulcina cf. delphinae)]|nr:antA/AntB antirepressor family protein [Candidatus Thiodiazotropha sp. (ex Epidulcina cf. delphinae)]
MTELIPLTQRFIAGASTRTVSARKLHKFLSSKRQFSDWIRNRINQYGFTENQDYILVSQKSEIKGKGGDRRSLDYYLTIDMAKELAMVERTDRGREARRYFISCEKQLIEQQEQKQLPQSSQRFLVLMENGQITSAQPVPIDCYAFRHEDIPRILKEHGKIAINKQDLITITRAVIEIKTALDRMDDDESQNEKLSHASH